MPPDISPARCPRISCSRSWSPRAWSSRRARAGFIATRVSGVAFAIICLAMRQVLFQIAVGWRAVTQGMDGLVGVPLPRLFGRVTPGPRLLPADRRSPRDELSGPPAPGRIAVRTHPRGDPVERGAGGGRRDRRSPAQVGRGRRRVGRRRGRGDTVRVHEGGHDADGAALDRVGERARHDDLRRARDSAGTRDRRRGVRVPARRVHDAYQAWQFGFGLVFVLVVLLFPDGLAGVAGRLWSGS